MSANDATISRRDAIRAPLQAVGVAAALAALGVEGAQHANAFLIDEKGDARRIGRVDQHVDPAVLKGPPLQVVRQPDLPSNGQAGWLQPRILLPRSQYRLFGPIRDGQPVPAADGAECMACGDIHQVRGFYVYTHGCAPVAMPIHMLGMTQTEWATFEVTDDAVPPVDMMGSPCMTSRFPHIHDNFEWVD